MPLDQTLARAFLQQHQNAPSATAPTQNANMASPPLSPASITCPRDGSKWYACSTGSMFVGCCKLNPCENGCEAEFVGSALLTKEAFGRLPEANCSSGSTFYSCGAGNTDDTYYWGCCKSYPCFGYQIGCPAGDNGRAFMKYSYQLSEYLKVENQNASTAYLGATADEAPLTSKTTFTDSDIGGFNARILVGLCLALLVVLPVAIALWFCYRRLFPRFSKRKQSPERYVQNHCRRLNPVLINEIACPSQPHLQQKISITSENASIQLHKTPYGWAPRRYTHSS